MEGRSSGILLPVFSLPGPYGAGTMGKEARSCIDFLASANQHYWQILPLVPPGGGDSPYMSPSSFAGNPFFLDLGELAEEGLLTRDELLSAQLDSPDRVDYDFLRRTRLPLLRKAWERGRELWAPRIQAFCTFAHWAEDYARFSALREELGLSSAEWPSPAPAPDEDDVSFHLFLQAAFFRQWHALKQYANERNVSIIGDLPICVSEDSAEFWAHPELFQIDGKGHPAAVAGGPPPTLPPPRPPSGHPPHPR